MLAMYIPSIDKGEKRKINDEIVFVLLCVSSDNP
jgi:hypothetical protein